MHVREAKKLLRQEIWKKLETSHIARFPLPVYGRIPNFVGSEKVAENARNLKEWREASVIFANPDYAQQKVREDALLDGKMLIMASPKLKHGFITVNSKNVKGVEAFASTIRGAFKRGRLVNIEELPKPDVIVEGSVAVDLQGHRLGKGGGYGDLETKTLKNKFGCISVMTTVHDMQIVEAVPFEENDEKISIIVTPTKIIRL